jgi:hypothetical protein
VLPAANWTLRKPFRRSAAVISGSTSALCSRSAASTFVVDGRRSTSGGPPKVFEMSCGRRPGAGRTKAQASMTAGAENSAESQRGTAADLPPALAGVTAAVATGKLTPEERQAVAAVLEVQRRGIELADHQRRLEALEARTRLGEE